MPNQHFRCPACGWFGIVVYKAADVDSEDWPPECGQVLRAIEGLTSWACACRLVQAPQPGDFSIDAREPFQRTEVWRQVPTKDGLVQQHEVIDSDHKMAQIEKDSEQRYRDGEGEPLRFRARHQSASNMDRNSFGESGQIGDRHYDSGQQPQPTSKVGVKRHGMKKPNLPLGPGVRRAGTALKG